MPVVNLPPMLRDLFNGLDSRVRKLEQSQSFQAPAVTSNPSPLRNGMIWYRSDLGIFFTYANGAVRAIGEMRYYGSFFDTTTQTIGSTTTAYAVGINTTDIANGFSIVSGSRITAAIAGKYNLQFSFQLQNSDTTDRITNIWLRKNGTDIADSNGQVTVPSRHGSVNGAHIAAWNYVLSLNANDYVEFWWQAESTQVSMPTVAAGTTPTTPRTPAVIVTIQQVAW
jgi:hypothetical protein